MTVNRLPNTATAFEIAETVKAQGYVIIDELVAPEVMDCIAREMGTYVEDTEYGEDNFFGKKTKRSGSLVARSQAARELIMHPLVIETAKSFLSHATNIQLHLTQIISVYPGSPAQMLHQDEAAWDLFPFPKDYHVQCNLLWAMTDYTENNGATRIVPHSQEKGPGQKYELADSIPAVMKKGSVLFYTGKVYHGAGENKSENVRQAVNLTYAVGWVRQEENQYLTTPPEIAKTLPTDLLKMIGYDYGCFGLGYTGDFEHPLTALGREAGESMSTALLDSSTNPETKEFF